MLLGYGPGSAWFVDPLATKLFALPEEIRVSLNSAEVELVESALPLAGNYRRLADFVTFIGGGGGALSNRAPFDGGFQLDIQTKSPPCKVHRKEPSTGSVHSNEVAIPGIYHTSLFSVLRSRILPDYVAMVGSVTSPADVAVLRRTFDSTFQLLVPVVCHPVSESDALKVSQRKGACDSKIFFPFAVTPTRSVSVLPETAETIHHIARFITSEDPPAVYRRALHESVYMSLLYHIAHFVAHGHLLCEPADLQIGRDHSDFYARTTGYGVVNKDFFLQPSPISAARYGEHQFSPDDLVVDTSKLPPYISPSLAGLILAAGRERFLLLQELKLADEIEPTDDAGDNPSEGRRIRFIDESKLNQSKIYASPFFTGKGETGRKTSILNVFHVSVPQTQVAVDLFSRTPNNSSSAQSQVLPHSTAAKHIFTFIHDLELCRGRLDIVSQSSVGESDSKCVGAMQCIFGTSGEEGDRFFGVFNCDELETRVSVGRAMWSAALWGIVKNGGVVDASAAAIEECDLMVVKKTKVGILSAALLTVHEHGGSQSGRGDAEIDDGAAEDEIMTQISDGDHLSPDDLNSIYSGRSTLSTCSQRLRRRWHSATARTAISTISISLSSIFYQLSVVRDMFMCHRGHFWQTFVETSFQALCGQEDRPRKRLDLGRIASEAFSQACLASRVASLTTFAPIFTREEAVTAARRALRRHSTLGMSSASSFRSAFSSLAELPDESSAANLKRTRIADSNRGTNAGRSNSRHRSVEQLHQVLTRVVPRSSEEDELTFLEDSFSMSVTSEVDSSTNQPTGLLSLANEAAALRAIKNVSRLLLHFHPPSGSAHLIVSPHALDSMQSLFQLYLQTKFANEALSECRRVISSLSAASFRTTKPSRNVVDRSGLALQSTTAGAAIFERICTSMFGGVGPNIRPTPEQFPQVSVTRSAVTSISLLVSKLQFFLAALTSHLFLDVQQREYDIFIGKFCATLLNPGSQNNLGPVSSARSGSGAFVDADGVASVFNRSAVEEDSEIRPFKIPASKKGVSFQVNEVAGSRPSHLAVGVQATHGFAPGISSSATINPQTRHSQTQIQAFEPAKVQTVEDARKAHDRMLAAISKSSFIPKEEDAKGGAHQIANALAELMLSCHMARNIISSPQLLAVKTSPTAGEQLYSLGLSADANQGFASIQNKIARDVIPQLYGHLSSSLDPAARSLWARLNYNRWFTADRSDATLDIDRTVEETTRSTGGVRALQRASEKSLHAKYDRTQHLNRQHVPQNPAEHPYNTNSQPFVYSLENKGEETTTNTGPF